MGRSLVVDVVARKNHKGKGTGRNYAMHLKPIVRSKYNARFMEVRDMSTYQVASYRLIGTTRHTRRSGWTIMLQESRP